MPILRPTRLLELGTMLAASFATAGFAGEAAGPLRIHPDNPRYFTDGTKAADGSLRAVYLTGAHTWNNLVDMGKSDPPEAFDFGAYLDFLEAHHHNFIRLWTWDSTVWLTEANKPLGKDFTHCAAPQPWARTGPGEAFDGKPKFDLTQFDSLYFERLRERVEAAGQRGMYVSIMLFEGWGLMHGNKRKGVSEPGWAWLNHPFHSANNINGIDGGKPDDPLSGEPHSLAHPQINERQAAYIRKVVDTVNDLDNVLYEVINEGGRQDWDWWVVDQVHEYERAKPKQHPVGITGHGAEDLASMLASPADWISPGKKDGYGDDPPAWNEAKVSLLDTDHIWGVGGNAAWVWKSLLRGHNPLFMDPYDGLALGEPGDPRWPPIREAMGHARRVAERLDLAAAAPRDDLASTGYCLAKPGSEYLVYLPEGGEAELKLRKGRYTAEWIDPDDGSSAAKEPIDAAAGKHVFQAPMKGHAVLLVQKRN
ncbi:MAG: hypothetical protein BWZ10_00730 [candidate division BRC1 bacterium ADurb.BinA364]|nr:MAG: hypothetical protein BWZ10_00730 [candidate division BRC1 bacterium ADurb.BinA364]